MPVQTAKASVELTKNDEGTWLNVEIGGRKATLSLNNANHGPLVKDILVEWAESHFLGKPSQPGCSGSTGPTGPVVSPPGCSGSTGPTGPVVSPPGRLRRTLTMAGECLLAGTMTLLLVGIIGGALWLVYMHAGSLAEGFGLAIGAGLLGGVVRYFKTTRRALHHLSGGLLSK